MNLITRFKQIEVIDLFFYGVASFFIFFVTWAAFAELDQVVRAEATVEPANKVQKIQSRYPGTIQSIDVEVGDHIKSGDTLFTLDIKNIDILLNSSIAKLKLLNEETDAIKPLVEAGIEPKMTLIRLKQQALEIQEKIDSYKLQLTNSDIKSNTGGLVTAVHVIGPGSVIREGEVLIEVVPKADFFVVKAKILPKDVSKVSVGQNARVSFTAYDFSRFGVMESTVTKIAHNTTITEQGEIYYDAWIRTNGQTFAKTGITPNIIPGMISQVDFLGEKRTILEYIMSPLNRGASRALTEF